MTLYREGRGADEYEPAEDQEILNAAWQIIGRNGYEVRWQGLDSDAPSVEIGPPMSASTSTVPVAPGVAKIGTTEPDDTREDDGGASSALTKERFEEIKKWFSEWPVESNPRTWAVLDEVERLHPEWASPPPVRHWRVNRTSTVIVEAEDAEAAKRKASEHLGLTVVMSAVEADTVMNDD